MSLLTAEKAEGQEARDPGRAGPQRQTAPRSHGLQRQGPSPAPLRPSGLLPGCRAATCEALLAEGVRGFCLCGGHVTAPLSLAGGSGVSAPAFGPHGPAGIWALAFWLRQALLAAR